MPPAAHRPVLVPLSTETYRVQFTVSKETEEQLRRLQDLLRAEIPDGDPGAIFIRALPLLLREVERKKFAATSRPRPGRGMKPGSRHPRRRGAPSLAARRRPVRIRREERAPVHGAQLR